MKEEQTFLHSIYELFTHFDHVTNNRENKNHLIQRRINKTSRKDWYPCCSYGEDTDSGLCVCVCVCVISFVAVTLYLSSSDAKTRVVGTVSGKVVTIQQEVRRVGRERGGRGQCRDD